MQCRLRPDLCGLRGSLTAQAVMSKIDLLAVYVQKDGYPIEQVSATAPRVSTHGVLRYTQYGVLSLAAQDGYPIEQVSAQPNSTAAFASTCLVHSCRSNVASLVCPHRMRTVLR